MLDDSATEEGAEVDETLTALEKKVASIETQTLLSGKHDQSNCIFTLTSGAGGTDAQDWTELLYRMYSRWMEKKNFQVDLVEQSFGDEAGLKAVTLVVKGPYAYGLLQNEIGIHRLVRLSPFNSNNKRQTSFAAVDVIPEISDTTQDIKFDPKELRIDTYRSSGAGGQHVNKTDSAVRVTHLPTGLVATSQNSRSQTANKETALSILKSRLLILLESQQKEKLEDLRGIVKEIAWGHQIRSYVFHPYKLVKDLRTSVETSNVQQVMDGDLDAFIEANLRHVSTSLNDRK
jgi:peptide chain release factor 2